jgi:hypothetical protein
LSIDSKTERKQTIANQWETDWLTYFRVNEDQQTAESLIPSGARSKDLSKQLDWRIEFRKGAKYNPAEQSGMYGRTVDIKYGCSIHGDVFAKDKVTIESGLAAKGRKEDEIVPGRILGNVVTSGEVVIEEPDETYKKQYEDWQPPLRCNNPNKRTHARCGTMLLVDLKNKMCQCPKCRDTGQYNPAYEQPLHIKGNVICDSATISAGVFIKGNLIAMKDININPGPEPYNLVVVKGNIVSLKGAISVSQSYSKTLRALQGVEVKDSVSLDLPIVMAEEGKINIENFIYVADPDICEVCKSFTDYITKRCEMLSSGECKKLDKLTQVDVTDYPLTDPKGQVATRTWRTFKEPEPGRLLVNIGHY